MPELPDLTIYREKLEERIVGATFESVAIGHPFLLRSVDPQPKTLYGKRIESIRLIGKRIVFATADEYFMVLHLMIAGRLKWRTSDEKPVTISRKRGSSGVLARFGFSTGTLVLTEAGTKRRASLMFVRGESELARIDPGGIDVLTADESSFSARMRKENHTLKRSLTDPRLFSGIGNSYSDEILHRARLSPFKQSSRCTDEDLRKLYTASRQLLIEWTERLREDSGADFPKKVTAFHPQMAVHGKYGKSCPECGSPIQRIRYAENESNYCAACQTGGKLLADRALSRILKSDWPATVEELEEIKQPRN